MPGRIAGKTALAEYAHNYPTQIEFEAFRELTIHEPNTPGTVVVEMRVTGRVRACS